MCNGALDPNASEQSSASEEASGSTQASAREQLDAVFFSDSGSVSVEVAIKIALHYQAAIGHLERKRLVTWRLPRRHPRR